MQRTQIELVRVELEKAKVQIVTESKAHLQHSTVIAVTVWYGCPWLHSAIRLFWLVLCFLTAINPREMKS